MPDNVSNTSDAPVKMSPVRVLRTAGPFVTTAFEMFVLAEILWYYLHDGEQTLHGAVAEWWEELRERARFHHSVAQVRGWIRNLPETGT